MQLVIAKRIFLFLVSYIDIYFILDHYSIVDGKKDILNIEKLANQAFQIIHENPREGIRLSKETFKISKEINYDKGIAESKLIEGWCLLLQNNHEKSLKALDYSLRIFKSIKDLVGEMKTLNAFGVLYSNISNYETAMDFYYQSLELGKKTNNSERLGTAYINIGSLYSEIGKNNEALEYYYNALDIIKGTNKQDQLCACLINIGDVHYTNKNYTKALKNYTQSLEIAESIKNRVYESNCLTSIGNLYKETNEFEKAEIYQERSLKISESLGNNLSKVECLTNLAFLYFAKKEMGKAIDYHMEAINLSKSINSRYFESMNYLGISKAFEQNKNLNKALESLKLYNTIKSELQDEEINIKLERIKAQNKIETAKKDAEIQKKKNLELQEAFDRVSILNKIGQDIISSLDMEIILANIYKHLSSFISADLFGIALYEEQNKIIDFKYFIMDGERHSNERKPVSAEGSMAGWVISNGKYLHLNDVQNEYLKYVPKLMGSKTDKTKSLIFAPLMVNMKILGVITVQSYKLNAYTKQDLEIIQAVGAYSAIALENSMVHDEINGLNKIINSEKKILEKAYDKIDRLANHDILTGLPNRRLFRELLKRGLRQADRQKTKTSVLFMDLDDFKPVNDKLGHDAGDKVLQMVTQRFISTLRESDTIARIGGDEFAAIICNVKNTKDIEKIAEKIICKFKNPFKIGINKFQLGISMGISVYPDDDDNINGLVKKADTAMYKIKSESKNSFVFFEEEK